MPLILGGGGSADQEAANLDHLAGLLNGSALLYLPLDAKDPGDPRFVEWIHSVLSPRGVTDIEICRSAHQASGLDLSRFGGVFMGGGNTYLLLQRLRATGLVAALVSAAERGLTIYGGSAGAIVLGAHIDTCAHLDDNFIGLDDTSGLNLCHGKAVWCHFHPTDAPRIEALVRLKDCSILALAEDSGVVVDGPNIGSIGATRVEIWTPTGRAPVSGWAAA